MSGRHGLVAVVAAVALVAGCSGSGGDDEPSGAGTETETTSETTATTEAPAPTDAPAPATTAAPAPAPDDGADAGGTTLPDAVGMDLQLAQDTMQASGFYLLTSHDATGQDRFQVLDRNWTVCDQRPAGGAPAALDTPVDFGAVKDGEPCP